MRDVPLAKAKTYYLLSPAGTKNGHEASDVPNEKAVAAQQRDLPISSFV